MIESATDFWTFIGGILYAVRKAIFRKCLDINYGVGYKPEPLIHCGG